MKTQSKVTTRSGDKSCPALQLHASATRQQLLSGQPTPAVWSQNEFTIEEHLRVQREIEKRAHHFWFAKGCAVKNALNDWLKAEDEVLAEFVEARTQCHSVPSASKETQTKTGGTSSWPPAILNQHPATSKLKSPSAFQHNS